MAESTDFCRARSDLEESYRRWKNGRRRGELLLARGLLFPGELRRRDALVLYGGQGVRLALGIIPVLVIAGILEGFFSPAYLPAAAKFACSVAAGGLLTLYLTQCGRKRR